MSNITLAAQYVGQAVACLGDELASLVHMTGLVDTGNVLDSVTVDIATQINTLVEVEKALGNF